MHRSDASPCWPGPGCAATSSSHTALRVRCGAVSVFPPKPQASSDSSRASRGSTGPSCAELPGLDVCASNNAFQSLQVRQGFSPDACCMLCLQLGVGTSRIQEEMVSQGQHDNIVNVDISSTVVKHMAELHAHLPQLTYRVADCRCWQGAAAVGEGRARWGASGRCLVAHHSWLRCCAVDGDL